MQLEDQVVQSVSNFTLRVLAHIQSIVEELHNIKRTVLLLTTRAK